MALPVSGMPFPHCSRCIRQLLRRGVEEWRPFQQQVRGKKKMKNYKLAGITVRLLKDVKAYGPKGNSVFYGFEIGLQER